MSILLESNSSSLKRKNLGITGQYSKIIYLDINTDYGLNSDQILVSNIRAINNQILNILFTVPGERSFEPTWGSELPFRVYDLSRDKIVLDIKTDVFKALSSFLPSITLDEPNCEIIAYFEQAAYDIKLSYLINNTTITGNGNFRINQ